MFRALLVFACGILLSSTTLGQKPDDASSAELKALVGKYRIEKVLLGGQDITEHLKEMKFEIKDGGKYTAQVGELVDDATFTVDPAKKPKEMDVKPTGGPQKGKLVKVIYKLDGDTLTMCYDHDKPENRQSKFESKEETTVLLINYKREKK
jgi:uncharacterized protein (TIGR03067 family)